jgi:hypothetical protein
MLLNILKVNELSRLFPISALKSISFSMPIQFRLRVIDPCPRFSREMGMLLEEI